MIGTPVNHAPAAAKARKLGCCGTIGSGAGRSAPADRWEGIRLNDLEREILDFERRWWQLAGAKDQAVMETFGISMTRYYQLLNTVLDDPAALAADPVTVNRLRRLRGSRRPPRAS